MCNHHRLICPKKITRSKNLNSFTLYYKNIKFEVNQITQMQQNQKRCEISLQLVPNAQQLLNDFILVINCRQNREKEACAAISVHNVKDKVLCIQ